MADATSDAEVVLHSWNSRLRVLSNPSAWQGVSLSIGGGSLGMGLLFAFISKSVVALYLCAGVFAGLMLIFVLVGAVIDLFGGFRVRFTLTSRGVWSRSGRGSRAAAEAAVMGGIVTGSLTGIAAGHLARSEQDVFIAYRDVTRVKVYARRRYVLVKGGWAQKPIGLSCGADGFARVLDLLRQHCPPASFTDPS